MKTEIVLAREYQHRGCVELCRITPPYDDRPYILAVNGRPESARYAARLTEADARDWHNSAAIQVRDFDSPAPA